MEEHIKNLSEIIELCNEEWDSDNENIHAILDLEDLKSLEKLIEGYKEQEKEINKLNEVIDKMAEYINKHIVVISRDIEESICCHNLDGKCINRKCEECVKKYFIEKED